MSTVATPPRPRSRARTVSRVGVVLAAIMAVFNTINGAGSLVDPTFGQTDSSFPPQPVWMSLALLVFGLSTLAFVVPAWRGHRRALWFVVVTRLLEAWSAVILPFLPGAPDGMWGPVALLMVVGGVVAGLVACGLRR